MVLEPVTSVGLRPIDMMAASPLPDAPLAAGIGA
jgi:hypothetical protein